MVGTVSQIPFLDFSSRDERARDSVFISSEKETLKCVGFHRIHHS